MSYSDAVTLDARLRLLQLLASNPAYTGNEVVLPLELVRKYGHTLTRDRVRTELTWLEDQGLLVLQKPGGIILATLTSSGLEVSCGIGRNPGVAAPRPGE